MLCTTSPSYAHMWLATSVFDRDVSEAEVRVWSAETASIGECPRALTRAPRAPAPRVLHRYGTTAERA